MASFEVKSDGLVNCFHDKGPKLFGHLTDSSIGSGGRSFGQSDVGQLTPTVAAG